MDPIFPPFAPDPEPQPARFRTVPLRVLVPNIITLLALAAGLTGMRLAIEGKLDHAALAIVAAAVLDGIDGRIARLLKGTSRFGAELDSLADFVSFGCAPAIILYVWKLHALKTLGWMVCLLLAFAAALRLARFNVQLDAPARPEWQRAYALGVPAPAGAMLALFPIFLALAEVPGPSFATPLILIWTLGVAALMVSRLPTFSGKGFGTKIPRERVVPLLALVIVGLALAFSHPFEVLAALTFAYAASLPIAYFRHHRSRMAEPTAPDGGT
jgi:CDP-diacylglycerol--serine O-phosphatidyltransferase